MPPSGQSWITPEKLAARHANTFRQHEPGLLSIGSLPTFAIGQNAILVMTPAGNVLWDCISLLDDATIAVIKGLGALKAIAISHPHFYTTMVDWSRAFGCPVHLHAADRKWVMRPDANIQFWRGEKLPLFSGVSLIRTGGHFDGFQVALWPSGAEGRGVLFAGDQPQVCADRRWVTFMYSYPNYIPLGTKAARHVADVLRELRFDRMYGAFPGRTIPCGAKKVIARSAARYLKAISV